MQNNLSICHFTRKDNVINAYLSKTVTDCLTFHFLRYGNMSLYSVVKNF